MDIATTRRRSLRVAGWALMLVAGAMVVEGCIATAAIVTVAALGGGGKSATVEVDATPDAVYQAVLSVVGRQPGVTITKQDPKTRTVAMERDKCKGMATVKVADDGKTLLTVKATSGEKDVSHEELAQRVTTAVCRELGVEYRVVEK